jgi:hypothetical protein
VSRLINQLASEFKRLTVIENARRRLGSLRLVLGRLVLA